MSWLKEFKAFALKGSMLDLAIGVILGTTFGKVVSSLVTDVIMPPIGLLLGGVDFSQLSLKMELPGRQGPPVELKYGLFFNTLIDFFIVAAVIFIVVKGVNRLRHVKGEEAPKTENCPHCQMAIPFQAKKCGHCCSNLR